MASIILKDLEFPENILIEFVNEIFPAKLGKKLSWLATKYYYVIDSNSRQRERLDKVLDNDLINPHPGMVRDALKFYTQKPDTQIISLLKYVDKRVKYVYDHVNFGKAEFWASASFTWQLMRDDCDGKNKLVGTMARIAAMPNYLLWHAIGDVWDPGQKKLVGHYWLIYFSTKHREVYAIDTTYKIDYTVIQNRNPFRFSDKGYANIWYLWNDYIILKPRR